MSDSNTKKSVKSKVSKTPEVSDVPEKSPDVSDAPEISDAPEEISPGIAAVDGFKFSCMDLENSKFPYEMSQLDLILRSPIFADAAVEDVENFELMEVENGTGVVTTIFANPMVGAMMDAVRPRVYSALQNIEKVKMAITKLSESNVDDMTEELHDQVRSRVAGCEGYIWI
jgi:hypothetical protein